MVFLWFSYGTHRAFYRVSQEVALTEMAQRDPAKSHVRWWTFRSPRLTWRGSEARRGLTLRTPNKKGGHFNGFNMYGCIYNYMYIYIYGILWDSMGLYGIIHGFNTNLILLSKTEKNPVVVDFPGNCGESTIVKPGACLKSGKKTCWCWNPLVT